MRSNKFFFDQAVYHGNALANDTLKTQGNLNYMYSSKNKYELIRLKDTGTLRH